MTFPLEPFIEEARQQGHSEAYLYETTAYINKLNLKGVPVIFSLPHLAMELGIRSKDLTFFIEHTKLSYSYFFLRKKNSSSIRQIMAPREKLKHTQRWINFNILQNLDYNNYITGFVPGTSILKNAKVHENANFLLKIDLLKFFDSITFHKVFVLFKEIGYVENMAYYFAQLCTAIPREEYWERFTKEDQSIFQYIINNKIRVLPQGAPTSPLIANLVASNLDKIIGALSDKMGFKYSRYADDLCFSAEKENQIPSITLIEKLVQENGFFVNKRKIHLAKKGERQYVTGLSINGKVSVKKSKRKEIFTHLHFLKKRGVELHLQYLKSKGRYHQNYQNWLFGHISFHYSIDKTIGKKMMDEYNSINWELDSKVSKIETKMTELK